MHSIQHVNKFIEKKPHEVVRLSWLSKQLHLKYIDNISQIIIVIIMVISITILIITESYFNPFKAITI